MVLPASSAGKNIPAESSEILVRSITVKRHGPSFTFGSGLTQPLQDNLDRMTFSFPENRQHYRLPDLVPFEDKK